MDPEAKDESQEFGKVIDALHSKAKLPSLRTYQGDMAEFIKERNESVISIAVKEKEKKQKEEEEEEDFNPLPKPNKTSSKGNFITIFVSILLIIIGIAGLFYVFNVMKQKPIAPVVVEENVIPYNNLIAISTTTKDNFEKEITKVSPSNGINIFKISDEDGLPLQKATDFFGFLHISLPVNLETTLQDQYAVGILSQDDGDSYFLVISVSDYGQAFSGMLDWEANMDKDLSFLNAKTDALVVNNNAGASVMATSTATSTATSSASTTVVINIPMKQPDVFSWKDLIIKNKDTRALVDEAGQARMAYTFLDKNTILITNNLSAIGDITSIYVSRSVVR